MTNTTVVVAVVQLGVAFVVVDVQGQHGLKFKKKIVKSKYLVLQIKTQLWPENFKKSKPKKNNS